MHPEEIRKRATPAADGDTRARWRAARASGPIAALTCADPSWDAGAASVDAAVDAGAGALLLVADEVPTAHARAVTALYCGLDASAVARTQQDDLQRMHEIAVVRDAMPPLRAVVTQPLELLAADAHLAWLTSCIAHASLRRTPVVIAGALPQIAALCAQRIGTACVSWVHWGIAGDDAAANAARTRLAREPWFTTTIPLTAQHMTDVLRAAVDALDGLD